VEHAKDEKSAESRNGDGNPDGLLIYLKASMKGKKKKELGDRHTKWNEREQKKQSFTGKIRYESYEKDGGLTENRIPYFRASSQ